ncbi:hypothetical protein M5362_02715 [Streptomyces sp. Je 1-79]|uniref:hypothetical protein n=1 Tax=Streptomyces sp. Je 1-79 TaxID=2943847 RepID=UPI0021A2EABE|nr:hypothetical protein [Streptomyces sp. Je 1-79]MCT4352047.1 hypothetical protein [Streptomyces sp. Je 1-79]
MTTGFASTGPKRPGQIEAAWALTLAAVAAEVLVWLLGVFVVPPTGLDELTEFSGRSSAVGQLAVAAAVLALLLGAWLAVAARMRAGRGWARAVLTFAGVLLLLFRVGDFSMDGVEPGWWAAVNCLPDVLAAAVVVAMYFPEAHAYFSRSSRFRPTA